MEAGQRILLYGNSVILGSIGLRLRNCFHCEVITVPPQFDDIQALEIKKPDIILFDLQTTHTEALFSLLEAHPAMLLIGVSPDVNLVKLWSGRQFQELSMQELIELIGSDRRALTQGNNRMISTT